MSKPMIECTIENLKKLADMTKDEPKDVQMAIAVDLPITAGCLYKEFMLKRHGIDVPI